MPKFEHGLLFKSTVPFGGSGSAEGPLPATHLQHPGGRVDALLDLGHALHALEVGDQVRRVLAGGAVEDDLRVCGRFTQLQPGGAPSGRAAAVYCAGAAARGSAQS